MLRLLSERNTITLPKKSLKRIGLEAGDYIEITDDGHRIFLTPKIVEDRFTDEEWKKLDKLTKEKGAIYTLGTEAKQHIDRLLK